MTDACGAGHPEAAERSYAAMAFAGESLTTDLAGLGREMAARR
ncbi:hypothetical protein [Nocardia sp. BSTN01]|nr:hypothetical protein [Nocardia sp. BSTN01]